MSVYDDALPMRSGEVVTLDGPCGSKFTVTAREGRAIQTGRQLYLVVCVACGATVHDATTGPRQQMNAHVRDGCSAREKPAAFRIDADGVIVGRGLRLPTMSIPVPGRPMTSTRGVFMTPELLERLFEVARLEAVLGPSDGDRIIERARERIEAAKAEIIEKCGIDPESVK